MKQKQHVFSEWSFTICPIPYNHKYVVPVYLKSEKKFVGLMRFHTVRIVSTSYKKTSSEKIDASSSSVLFSVT